MWVNKSVTVLRRPWDSQCMHEKRNGRAHSCFMLRAFMKLRPSFFSANFYAHAVVVRRPFSLRICSVFFRCTSSRLYPLLFQIHLSPLVNSLRLSVSYFPYCSRVVHSFSCGLSGWQNICSLAECFLNSSPTVIISIVFSQSVSDRK